MYVTADAALEFPGGVKAEVLPAFNYILANPFFCRLKFRGFAVLSSNSFHIQLYTGSLVMILFVSWLSGITDVIGSLAGIGRDMPLTNH